MSSIIENSCIMEDTDIHVGCLALGVVLSVSSNLATISLYGGCVGTIARNDFWDITPEDSMENFIKIHQIMKVRVIGKGGNSTYLVSSKLSDINRDVNFEELHSGTLLTVSIVRSTDNGSVSFCNLYYLFWNLKPLLSLFSRFTVMR